MPALVSQIQADLISAMKNKDEIKLSVLRMLKSSIQLAQAEKGRNSVLADDEVVVLLRRLIKQRTEAAEMYNAGGAADRAWSEIEESKVLEGYLPTQLTDEALKVIVVDTVQAIGATGVKDMGKVMGRAMAAVKGQADGNRVKAVVDAYLSSLS